MTNNLENQANEQEKHPSLAIANKSPVSKARKDMLERPHHVLAHDGDLISYKNLFDPYFEVKTYFGKCSLPKSSFPYGVNVATITAKGKVGVIGKPVTFVVHESEENIAIIDRIQSELAPFARTTSREVLDAIVAYVQEMRKLGEYEEVEEAQMNALLSETLGVGEALKWFQMLEIEMESDPELLASLSHRNYRSKDHHGVLLNTPRAKRKYGEYAIGVHRKLLLSLFCEIDIADEDSIEMKVNNPMLNQIIASWRSAGFLYKKTELTRGNEKIFGLNDNNESDRFYVIQSEKLYKAWNEYMKEEGLENGKH